MFRCIGWSQWARGERGIEGHLQLAKGFSFLDLETCEVEATSKAAEPGFTLSGCKVLLNITLVFCMLLSSPVGWEALSGGGIEASPETYQPWGSAQVASANRSYRVSHTSPETSQLCTAALPSTCSFHCPCYGRKQGNSSRGAAAFPITHALFLFRTVLCSFQGLTQIQRDFQGLHNNCSQAHHLLLAMQGMPGHGPGGASRHITSCMTCVCFVPNCSLFFLVTTPGKKPPTCSSKSSFSSRAGERNRSCCGWILRPNTSSGRIQKHFQPVIF